MDVSRPAAQPEVWEKVVRRLRTGVMPPPDLPTIEAVTKLMLTAGLSTEGSRPKVVDIYERSAVPSQATQHQ